MFVTTQGFGVLYLSSYLLFYFFLHGVLIESLENSLRAEGMKNTVTHNFI